MDMRLFVTLVLLFYSSCAMSGTAELCSKISDVAMQNKALIPGYMSGRKVIGKGRLYFYSAPDPRCRIKNRFVIPNDRVEAYFDYRGFTSVAYWGNGEGADGWVLSNRLIETGTGIGNKEEHEGLK